MDSSARKPPVKSQSIDRTNAETKRIEHEQAEAEALFLSIGEGALVTDANGNVKRINQAGLDILRIKEKDIIGKWYPDTVVAESESGDLVDYIDRPIAEVFITGKPVSKKLYFRRHDGTRVPVSLNVSPVMLKGKPIGAIEIFRDISREVRLDRAKDEFISLASHQLRTPATGVKQYLNMLLDGYVGQLTEAQRKFVDTANQSNDRQLRIIDDILKVAAADAGDVILNKEAVDLISLTRHVIEEQLGRITKRQQILSFEASASKMVAEVDKDALRMVLENLIDNASKYTYPGKNINVSIIQHGENIRIAVSDEGIGIPKKDIPKLFVKFSRIRNPLSVSSGGTGLGLYWVRQIVDLHNGSIAVKSEPEKGTTFTVTIPAHI